MKTLIFEKPSLAPLTNRIGWTVFTAFFWFVWIYLWMPLITLFLWWIGFNLFDKYLLQMNRVELNDMKNLMTFYLLVIIFLGGSLLTWAASEFMRFRNIHQRTRPLPVDVAELANFAHIPTVKIAELNLMRRMIAHHDEHGKFLYAEIG